MAITPMLSQLSILSYIHNSPHHPSSPYTFNPIPLSVYSNPIVSKTIHHGQCIFTSFLLEGIGLINRLKPLATLALSTNSLTDRIRNAELREVELWENERCDSQTAARFASVVANAGHDTNASAPSTSRIGRKLSESLAFSSSSSTSPTVKKAKKAAKSNTNTPTSPTWIQTRTRNALLETLAPLPPFALIPPLPASAMGDLVEEGGIEATLELEQKEHKENQNQKRPSLSMLPPKRIFSSLANHIPPNPVASSSSSANHINSISPEITQAIQTFKKGFSKSNLGTERAPWTKGRDGFGGINPLGVGLGSGSGSGNTSTSMGTGTSGGGRRTMSTMSGAHGDGDEVKEDSGGGSGYEAGPGPGPGPAALGPGMISNNLTFSLAPGWKFLETEDWRVDYDAGAGAGASSVGAFKTDKDKVSSPLSIDAEDGRDGDEDGDGDGEDGEDDGGEDEGDFGNRKSGRWLNITFKVGVRKCTRPIGPSHVRQARQSREERQEQWEQEQQRKRKLEISFFIVFGVSVNVDVGFSFGGRGGTGVGGGTGTGRSGVNDQGEDKGWMCGGDEDGFIYTNDAWQNPSPTPYPGSDEEEKVG
ncbi:hypothetical protein D9758_015034 [Tetrapyrgos nigripes]|uniref:Uncharacterized protein n=1 Tax=Tetrapyrgos nigripes TaxID=182062 RepID=A0A8H5CFN1_9AGAR|nr:hypothetical protein D9758_015034 [Tetrapyrgos nigripes]